GFEFAEIAVKYMAVKSMQYYRHLAGIGSQPAYYARFCGMGMHNIGAEFFYQFFYFLVSIAIIQRADVPLHFGYNYRVKPEVHNQVVGILLVAVFVAYYQHGFKL